MVLPTAGLAVTDVGNKRMQLFRSGDYAFEREFTLPYTHEPYGVATDRHGRLFVTVPYQNRLHVLNVDGACLRTVGTAGEHERERGEDVTRRGLVSQQRRGVERDRTASDHAPQSDAASAAHVHGCSARPARPAAAVRGLGPS